VGAGAASFAAVVGAGAGADDAASRVAQRYAFAASSRPCLTATRSVSPPAVWARLFKSFMAMIPTSSGSDGERSARSRHARTSSGFATTRTSAAAPSAKAKANPRAKTVSLTAT
jgi:hypothetical protein